MKKSLLISLCFGITISTQAQYTLSINPAEGYTPQIGVLISMLDELKGRVTSQVQQMNQEETDYLMDDKANRFGALILHLAATERYYQQNTFHDIKLNEEDESEWSIAFELGDKAREVLKDKPISYYLEKWDEVRNETKRVLKTKDDQWLLQTKNFSPEYQYNHYWAWYHVMEHQANHMGQIALMKKRLNEE
ncbi:MAG: DUF664 domain-containing protein [Cyclobacteriaceae bacterium]